MIEIVLVRHAEPDWEPGGRAVDEPVLTPRGLRQAACVVDALRAERFDHVYVSPLPRAQQTAAPLLDELGMEAETEGWLQEFGLPSLEGRTSEQVQRFFEGAMRRDMDQWWEALPGGEAFREFCGRIDGGLRGLLARHGIGEGEDGGHRIWKLPAEDLRILIVAHQGTNAVLVSNLLGGEPLPWTWLGFRSCHAGVSRLHTLRAASGAIWVLDYLNRVTHLAPIGELTY